MIYDKYQKNLLSKIINNENNGNNSNILKYSFNKGWGKPELNEGEKLGLQIKYYIEKPYILEKLTKNESINFKKNLNDDNKEENENNKSLFGKIYYVKLDVRQQDKDSSILLKNKNIKPARFNNKWLNPDFQFESNGDINQKYWNDPVSLNKDKTKSIEEEEEEEEEENKNKNKNKNINNKSKPEVNYILRLSPPILLPKNIAFLNNGFFDSNYSTSKEILNLFNPILFKKSSSFNFLKKLNYLNGDILPINITLNKFQSNENKFKIINYFIINSPKDIFKILKNLRNCIFYLQLIKSLLPSNINDINDDNDNDNDNDEEIDESNNRLNKFTSPEPVIISNVKDILNDNITTRNLNINRNRRKSIIKENLSSLKLKYEKEEQEHEIITTSNITSNNTKTTNGIVNNQNEIENENVTISEFLSPHYNYYIKNWINVSLHDNYLISITIGLSQNRKMCYKIQVLNDFNNINDDEIRIINKRFIETRIKINIDDENKGITNNLDILNRIENGIIKTEDLLKISAWLKRVRG